MLAAVPRDEIGGASVLEIGGGVGALQTELLEAGASRGSVVELVDAYEPYARQLARERGLSDRSTFRVVDVLEQPLQVDPATVVVLNRVVCCSPDGVELTGVAARLARRTLLLSFPRERRLVRVGLRLANVWQGLLRRSFRVFLHPRAALFAAADAEGLRLVAADRGRLWEFAAFQRTP
jgi:hypothetical protein